jgi:hypothetical protein
MNKRLRFFHGAALPGLARLLQGTGKFMRDVKLRAGTATNAGSAKQADRSGVLGHARSPNTMRRTVTNPVSFLGFTPAHLLFPPGGPRLRDCRRRAGPQASDVGSILIARSINPVDAVGFTGFPPADSPLKRAILDAVGREMVRQETSWTRRFWSKAQ